MPTEVSGIWVVMSPVPLKDVPVFIVQVPVVQDFFFVHSLRDCSPLPSGKCRVPPSVPEEGLGLVIGGKDNIMSLVIATLLARLRELSNAKAT